MTSSTVRPRRRGADQDPPRPASSTQTADPASPPNQFAEITAALRASGAMADLPDQQAGPLPPALQADGAALAVAGWKYGQAITHLFSYDSPQGAWVFVNGPGWKRLSPASSHGVTHMMEIATMATQANLPVNYHEDAAGLIDQLYV